MNTLAPQRILPSASSDERARVRMAAAADTAPAMLLELAADPRPTVRAAVAMNPAAPRAVDALLALDGDTRIRSVLAQKLARLLPSLPPAARATMESQALATLQSLVTDTATRVRAVIAEIVADMHAAPHSLVLALARDTELEVADPVIRLSPLLTTDDLLGLIATPPMEATLEAIARRPRLTQTLTDALAASPSSSAIAAMLGNHTAAIREATLDQLIARAGLHPGWHAPLAHRPLLTAASARALSAIVADDLLAALSRRADLPDATSADLRVLLATRLADAAPTEPDRPLTDSQALAHVRCMLADGGLDELAIRAALERGDLTLLAGLRFHAG